MTVRQMTEILELDTVCMPNPEREVTGGYAGDLLSWVMGRAKSGDAWITIMSNVNIVAVATLAEPACIILAEGVKLDSDALSKALDTGINILSGKKDTFALCAEVARLL